MKPVLRAARRAFTLIELLVAMSIIVVLTSLVLLVMTNINERDGTTDAAGLTRQWLMISKARAGRDNAPRGIRLITGLDPNNPAKTGQFAQFWPTEMQYIEAPPILITYPAGNGDQVPTGASSDPVVVFTYTLSPGPPPAGNPAVGTVTSRRCFITNLRGSDAIQIVPNSLLQLPVLGSWHRITNSFSITAQPNPPALGFLAPFTTFAGLFTVEVALDSFPDSQLGAAGVIGSAGVSSPSYVTQYFGISAPPRPLLGEPPLQLPKNICIDLTPFTPLNGAAPASPPFVLPPSLPQGQAIAGVAQDYDILFTPNGTVLPIGAGAAADGMIMLWHRDYTKLKNAAVNTPLILTNNAPRTFDLSPFQNGGEQQIVAIRCKTGSLGQFPVLWPTASGQYGGVDPFEAHQLARLGATSP